jgi:hypothetical protein
MGQSRLGLMLVSDRELDAIFGDEIEPVPTVKESTAKKKPRNRRTSPLAKTTDDGFMISSIIPEAEHPFVSNLSSYFQRAVNLLVDEFRVTLNGMLNSPAEQEDAITRTLQELVTEVKSELLPLLDMDSDFQSWCSSFFDPYRAPFQASFKRAHQFSKRLKLNVFTDCRNDMMRLHNEVLPGLDSLRAALSDLSGLRKVAFEAKANEGDQAAARHARMTELIAASKTQELESSLVLEKLAMMRSSREGLPDEPRDPLESEFEDFSDFVLISSAKNDDQFRDLAHEIRATLVRVQSLRNQCDRAIHGLAKQNSRRHHERTELPKSELPTKTTADGIADGLASLRSMMNRVHSERRENLQNTAVFLENVKRYERKSRRPREPEVGPVRTLYHW